MFKHPEIMAGTPKTNKGKGCQSRAKGAIKGANKQTILEIKEQVPTAWLRKLVGYNSEVTKNTIEKATSEAALPNNQNPKMRLGRSRGIIAKHKQDKPNEKCPKNSKGLRPNLKFKMLVKKSKKRRL